MKRALISPTVLLAALALASCSKGPVTPSTPGVLMGIVRDTLSNDSLAGAKVVAGTSDSTWTGSDGKFILALLQGRQTIQVSKDGYYGVAANVPIISRDTTRITVYTHLQPWAPGTPMASPGDYRHNFASVVWGGLLYLIGGRQAQSSLDLSSTLTYSPGSNAWPANSVQQLSPGRQLSACAVCRDTLYLFGGLSGSNILSNVLKLSTSNWSGTPNPLPSGVYATCAAAVGDSVFLMGGFIGPNTATNLVLIYKPSADTSGGNPWRLGPALPSSLGGISCATLGATIYLFGGRNGGNSSRAVYSLNVATDTVWITRTNMDAARAYAACAVVNNMIYVFGGLDGTTVCNTTYRYNPASNNWTVMEPMPLARYGAAAAAYNNRVHVLGGFDGTNSLGIVEVYNPAADMR